MNQVTIIDASTGRHVTGKLIKHYPNGLTIEDDRDVRYYATTDRVIHDGTKRPLAPGDNGNLWQ